MIQMIDYYPILQERRIDESGYYIPLVMLQMSDNSTLGKGDSLLTDRARSRQMEEDFWKIKAQKAEVTIHQLRKENHQLNKRQIEMTRIEDGLRERNALLGQSWHRESRKMSLEERQELTSEVERLTREIRILKNSHELEVSQAKDEVRALKRQLDDEKEKVEWNGRREKEDIQRVARRLRDEIEGLKKRLEGQQEVNRRLREEKTRVTHDCEELRKEIQELRIRERVAQKEEQQRLQNYRKYHQEFGDLRLSKRKLSSQTNSRLEIKEEVEIEDQESIAVVEEQPEVSFSSSDREEELLAENEKLRKQITTLLKKQREQTSRTLLELSQFENDRRKQELELSKMQNELDGTKQQLENVLRKLAPLVGRPSQYADSAEAAEGKAAQTLLEVLLKLYKIQEF